MEPIRVDIWSDIACPWCFIGKRRFERALTEFGADPANPPVELTYHSFELSPDTPVEFDGGEVAFLVRHKNMAAAEVRTMLQRVTEIAAGEGLAYDFDALRHTNTVLAHQFLHAAKRAGRQEEAYERLFRAYFEEGRHLGRVPELVALAAEVGLDPAAVQASLESGEFLPDVRADQRAAAEIGVRGVPFFRFDDRYVVTGAVDPAQFLAPLEALAAERRS